MCALSQHQLSGWCLIRHPNAAKQYENACPFSHSSNLLGKVHIPAGLTPVYHTSDSNTVPLLLHSLSVEALSLGPDGYYSSYVWTVKKNLKTIPCLSSPTAATGLCALRKCSLVRSTVAHTLGPCLTEEHSLSTLLLFKSHCPSEEKVFVVGFNCLIKSFYLISPSLNTSPPPHYMINLERSPYQLFSSKCVYSFQHHFSKSLGKMTGSASIFMSAVILYKKTEGRNQTTHQRLLLTSNISLPSHSSSLLFLTGTFWHHK